MNKCKTDYIVDGIDVSTCKYFKEYYCENAWQKGKSCKANKRCGFKQRNKDNEMQIR